MPKPLFGPNEFPTEMSKILAAEVLELAAFEEIPHLFLW